MTSSVKGEGFAKDDARGGLAEDDIIIYHAVLGPKFYIFSKVVPNFVIWSG